ncbi:MAG: hypothetical protein J2P24_13045 [Streptosporangiales bacterium]|nr:hypothetical protein [Streptosporangiales bacterium]
MDVDGSLWRTPSRVHAPRWLEHKTCRQELPCLFAGVFGHHEVWLLVAAIALLTASRVLRWARRATARAQLRRMRNA